MMSEWNGAWEVDRNRACSSVLELFTVCFKILKKNTLSKFIKELRQFLYLYQESFLYLFSTVWLRWNWQISKLKNTTNFERKYGALFIAPKPRLLHFRQLPVANRAAFSKISIKEDNLAWYTQIFEKSLSFRATLHVKISRNFGWVVHISEIQPFPGFLKLFREISVAFAAVSKVSKVLVEWKAPMVYAWCTVFPGHFLREKPSERALRNSR